VTLGLIADAQRGDREALERVFQRCHDHLLLAVRLRLGRRLRSVLESGDVFQSVALEVLRDLGDFVPRGSGSFRRYLNQLVLNKIRDRARYFDAGKRRAAPSAPRERLEDLPARESAAGYLDPLGRFERLEREIARLPEDMRRVVILRRVDGLPSKEVARLLGKSDATVRKTYSRALGRIAARMSEEGDP